MSTVEQMMEGGELSVSEHSIRLLEHERMKYQFFATLSKEIQFEYTKTPEMLILSEWGAKYLNMPETILAPREASFGIEVFSKGDFEQLLMALEATTPKEPMVEEVYLLNINGQGRWSKVIARSMWGEEEPPEYAGAIGKIVDIHEDMEKCEALGYARRVI